MPSATSAQFDLIGVGNPIMDLLALVPDTFLQHVSGEKGGMVLVAASEITAITAHLDHAPAQVAGGSAGNTTVAAANLGLACTYLGKIGNDSTADAYRANLASVGSDISRLKIGIVPNGRCLSLVTPDSERTMRTDLGAAMTLSPEEIDVADFTGCRHAHIEGYLLFNEALADAVVNAARAAGCSISIDLASFEVVGAARPWILRQLEIGIEAVFANEDEARALFQSTEAYDVLARRLAAFGGIAAVKLGKDGAWIAQGETLHRIPPIVAARVVDTTGAGDSWAAGFLAGHLRGAPLPISGQLGSLLGARCVQFLGPAIPPAEWEAVRTEAATIAAT